MAPQTHLPPRRRRHELDWLRALAVVAVFLHHVLVVYASPGWLVESDAQSPLLREILAVTADWRMPLMFFVAGAACMLALGGRRVGPYLRERATRLLVPLAVGVLALLPAQEFVAAATRPGGVGALRLPISTGGIAWGHLWFLVVLVLVTLAVLPICLWLRSDHAVKMRLRSAAALQGPLGVGVLALPVLAAVCVRTRWVEGLHVLWAADVRQFCLYGAFFLNGALLAAVPPLGASLVAHRRHALAGWAALAVVLAVLRRDEAGASHVHVLTAGLAAWLWTAGVVGYACRYLTSAPPLLSRFADVSYAFYLIHQLAIAAAAVVVLPLPLPIWLEAPLLAAAALPLGLGGCALIGRWPLSRLLFGLRVKPRPARTPVVRLSGPVARPSGPVPATSPAGWRG